MILKRLVPPRLEPGDIIGVISPASPPYGEKRQQYEKGINYLKENGYRVLEGQHVLNEHGYLAGTDQERLYDLNEMFGNPEVKAIFCSRGGYGTPRIIAKVNYDMIRRNPKIFVGYSDITSLQLAIFAQTGLISYSGPMIAVEMGKGLHPFTEDYFWRTLTLGETMCLDAKQTDYEPIIYKGGSAEGILLGGCFSLINPLIGSPFLPDFTNAILFLEDTGESIYAIDRLFAQMRLSGLLNEINGIVLGQFLDTEQKNTGEPSLTFEQVIHDYTGDLGIPVLGNFPYGHGDVKFTLPLGSTVRLDCDNAVLEMLEPNRLNT